MQTKTMIRSRIGVRVAESSHRRPETRSRRTRGEQGRRRSRARAAAAEERPEQWYDEPGEQRRRNKGVRMSVVVARGSEIAGAAAKSHGTRGGKERRSRRANSGTKAQRQRRERQPHARAARPAVSSACVAEEIQSWRVAVDFDDDSGRRRRRRWWRGLCDGGDRSSAAEIKKWVCREKGRGGWVSGFNPFLGSDRSSLSLIVYR
ncbi:hypothetical protein Syun_014944 [Stephania yunnanensis]|uniref:Uncharacterized protein n=1 Tax=Stephania yunnanensis TaxID=152371 RepID=A0AAP0JKL9_9MAGN